MINQRNGEGAPAAHPDLMTDEAGQAADVSDFRVTDVPGLIAIWALTVIVFLQFFTRYVLNDSLAWTEELARYVMVVVAFFGAVSVSRKGQHIFLEFFYRYLPLRIAKLTAVAMEAVSMLFWGFMAYQAVLLGQKTRTKMASIELPKNLLFYAAAIALAFMALYSAIWLVRKIRQRPEDLVRQIEKQALSEISD
ncbi:TRAP transporter small permease [Roseibium suaedae]|uniref:TRAP transporter small permease protein n=1 Tax=Roseibium suaedae TaxID=735517 RepID=A0A1M7I6S5_9HYPH|nr:TRAP transporter small permease [Roseibium suaedae]SHM36420.1 TRAP-type C4-dicarboxylate transport system, small permease component [Roseibium suaedae]